MTESEYTIIFPGRKVKGECQICDCVFETPPKNIRIPMDRTDEFAAYIEAIGMGKSASVKAVVSCPNCGRPVEVTASK